jgi:hypothetical protein
MNGFKWTLTLLDNHLSYASVTYLKKKSDTFKAFKLYVGAAENKLGRKVKAIQFNKGGEFINKEVEAYCAGKGIKIRSAAACAHQSNGRAKRF